MKGLRFKVTLDENHQKQIEKNLQMFYIQEYSNHESKMPASNVAEVDQHSQNLNPEITSL